MLSFPRSVATSAPSALVAFFAFFALASLQACFLDDGRRGPSSSSEPSQPSAPGLSSCTEGTPQILALDMQPSASLNSAGDYEISGTIRYSCSGVSVQAHVLTPEAFVRWAPSERPGDPATISLRFAASEKGHTITYEVTVLDAKGTPSSPPLRQAVALE
jgi:hypothetical protein